MMNILEFTVDDEAFSRLVAPHLETMLHLAVSQVGRDDAEDVTQEAITHAWRARQQITDLAAMRGWLLRITLNACYEWRRGLAAAGRRGQISLTDAPDLPSHLGLDPGASGHHAALDLRAAMVALSEDEQRIVTLRYFVGLDATEIGSLLGMPPSTVRSHVRRAIAALRAHLDTDVAERRG